MNINDKKIEENDIIKKDVISKLNLEQLSPKRKLNDSISNKLKCSLSTLTCLCQMVLLPPAP